MIINGDPILRQGQYRSPMHLSGDSVRIFCHLKDKTCSKLLKGLNIYVLKKKLTPGFFWALP